MVGVEAYGLDNNQSCSDMVYLIIQKGKFENDSAQNCSARVTLYLYQCSLCGLRVVQIACSPELFF